MRQWDYNIQMSMIRTLRELDTDGTWTAVCDDHELYLRRKWMDEPMITRGGICRRSYNHVQVELVRTWPGIYFSLTRAYRPRFPKRLNNNQTNEKRSWWHCISR